MSISSLRLRSKFYLSFGAVLMFGTLVAALMLVMMLRSNSSYKHVLETDRQVAEQALIIRADELRISAALQDNSVVIKFRDNGPGISEEMVGKIFEPFFTTKAVGHGTGLGLSIVHGIIERHGGNIRVESRPGVGTTFIVELPLQNTASGSVQPNEILEARI